jgi:hypothetical protein
MTRRATLLTGASLPRTRRLPKRPGASEGSLAHFRRVLPSIALLFRQRHPWGRIIFVRHGHHQTTTTTTTMKCICTPLAGPSLTTHATINPRLGGITPEDACSLRSPLPSSHRSLG